MCLPLIGAAVGLVGTAVSFSAAQQQAAMEQQIAERNARMEELRGRYEAKQIDRKVRYMQGKAAVQASAAGIGQGGSFLDIIADNAVQGEIDAENTRRNAENRASNIRFEGAMQAKRTKNSAIAGLISGGSNFLKAVA